MSSVKEHPILFSGPMVRAILEGRKTQTRRVVTEAYKSRRKSGVKLVPELLQNPLVGVGHACPYGVPGAQLWVRETFFDNMCPREAGDYSLFNANPDDPFIFYRADGIPDFEGEENEIRWRPSIFMPRWASRLTLEILDVRIQRVQAISEDDAKAEGVTPNSMTEQDIADLQISDCDPQMKELARLLGPGQFSHKFTFEMLWDELNARRGFGWKSNPWVWAITFRRIKA